MSYRSSKSRRKQKERKRKRRYLADNKISTEVDTAYEEAKGSITNEPIDKTSL